MELDKEIGHTCPQYCNHTNHTATLAKTQCLVKIMLARENSVKFIVNAVKIELKLFVASSP